MGQTKATKKFERSKLKDVLKRRKESAKVKQKAHMKAKRKARNAADNEKADGVEDETKKPSKPDANGNAAFAEMSVDEFFQGGFDIPEMPKQKKANKKKDAAAKSGKRKRTQAEDKEDTDDSDVSVEQHPVEDDESGSEDGSDVDIDAHKEQLAALAEKDPEFYKYLKENDDELLDFAEDADLAEMDALSASEDEETPRKKRKRDASLEETFAEAENEVSGALVKKWHKALTEQKSLRATKEVVLAFRAAAHLNEEDDKKYKYSISNPDVYHELLVVALKHLPTVVQHHLPVKESAAGKIRVPTDSKKFRTLAPMLRSHATSVHHLLENLSDAATQRLTLDSLHALLPYTLSFKKLVRDIAKTVVDVWSDHSNTEATRIAAFLVIRRFVVIGDPGIREAVLKATYQGLLKGSRNTTVHTLQGVNLMKNSAAELWGLDANIGYTTGFTFIRQLAIHLRSSITNNSKESYKTVYNWQYVHSLDFWSRVLSAHCNTLTEAEAGKESPLRPLIYPVVQITLGAMRLIPTAQYFPLRFQLIRSLLRLSQATGTYIPLAPALHEVLNSAEMKKPPKPSTLKPMDFHTSIRAAKSYLRTRTYQDGVGEQVAELVAEFFILWAKNVAFPELALPVVVMLKRWLKEVSGSKHGGKDKKAVGGNKNGKVNGMIALVVQKLEANARWIEERRAKVDFAPNNRAGVEGFLREVEWEKTPLGAFVVGQRKNREEKARILEEGRKEEEKKKAEERKEKADARAENFDDAVIEAESEEEEEEEEAEEEEGEDEDEEMEDEDDE